MSSKLFQGLIYQMKEAVDRTVGVLDDKGVVIACSTLSRIGESHRDALDEVSYSFDTAIVNGFTYKPVGSHARIEYVVFAEGSDEKAKSAAAMLSITLASIKTLYDEKYDKTNFIKNIILDNILPSDIYNPKSCTLMRKSPVWFILPALQATTREAQSPLILCKTSSPTEQRITLSA